MKTLITTIICCITLTLGAQKPVIQKNENFITFDKAQKLNTHTFLKKHRQNLDLQTDEDLQYLETQMDNLGHTHYRYQFTYKGIPVDGAIYLFHEEGGILHHANGNLRRTNSLRLPSVTPSLNEQQALTQALNKLNAKRYAWEDPQYEIWLKEQRQDKNATFLPQGELLIATDENDQYHLAYRFEIMSLEPMSRKDIYIDAQTGQIIKEYDKLYTFDELGSGNTSYYGNKNFLCKFHAGHYDLKEDTRNIETLDASNYFSYFPWSQPDPFTSYSLNTWSDPAAIDVHWGAEQWYDYFQTRFGWQSYNNNGAKITSLVHKGNNNAAYNGVWFSFGDGIGPYNIWTSIDMVAHELTHAFIEYTAGLRYWGESGALNEALADIFGTIIEHEALGQNANYLIGEEITKNGNGIRSMQNPSSHNDPSQYQGQHWYTGNGDNGGVHTNSGVANHWFYLLVEDTTYGIGMDKAADIIFRTTRYYFTPYSQYHDARYATLQAAIDLYGASSDEAAAVCGAWNAVNVSGTCTSNQSIAFNPPLDGTTLTIGNTVPITWISSNDFQTVSLDASIDGGNSWFPIFSVSDNDGTHNWLIPNIPTTQARLRIRNANNAAVEDITGDFTIAPCDAIASFLGDTYTCFGDTLSFTNTSTNATTAEWLLDGVSQSNNNDFTHIFPQAGTYQLELRAGNGTCYSSTFKDILVVDSTNVVDFTHQANGLNVVFSATSDDTEATYTWDFGDGNTSTGKTVTHTFGADSLYQVCLEVGNACGSFVECNNAVISMGSINVDLCQDEWNAFLNGEQITALVDQDSLIWVGTRGGLVRIVKSTSNITFYNNTNSELPYNQVTSLIIDPEGNLWIGAYESIFIKNSDRRLGSLIKYDGINTWEIYNSSNSILPDSYYFNSMGIDSQGNIWIGGSSRLIMFDRVSAWQDYNTSNSPINNYCSIELTIDRQDNIWIGCDFQFLKFDGIATWETFNLPLTNSSDIGALMADQQDNIWIGTWNGAILKYDGTSTWNIYDSTNPIFQSYSIFSLQEDLQGNIWAGTRDGGLYKLASNGSWQNYSMQNSSLPYNTIWELALDNQGNILVGTENGLVSFDGINTWQSFQTSDSGLPAGFIYSLIVDSADRIWMFTGKEYTPSEAYLVKFDGDDNWERYNSSNSPLPSNVVYDMLEDKNGSIWLTTGSRLVKFDGMNTWKIYTGSDWFYLNFLAVRNLFEDSFDNIWIGASNGYLIKFNGINSWELIQSPISVNEDDHVSEMIEDSQGDFWLVMSYETLLKFDGVDNWEVIDTTNSGLGSSNIYSLIENAQGQIIVGTSNGTLKYDKNGTWYDFQDLNPDMPSFMARIQDEYGYLWGAGGYSGDYGVVRFDGKNSWQLYSTSNSEIPNIQVTSLAEDSQGSIWVGSFIGLGQLKPDVSASFEITGIKCTTDTMLFENKSFGSNIYEWQINNVKISNEKDLKFRFDKSGTYSVNLITSNNHCSDVHSQIITIPFEANELNLPEYASLCKNNSTILDAGIYSYASYEWMYNNDSIGNQATLQVAQTGDYTLTVIDSCGNTASDTITVIFDEDCIWPGDINKDSIVNNKDFLFLGLAYDITGSERPGATLDFIGQAAPPFNGTFRDSINFKHADCNGDGSINEADKQAIAQNYGLQRGTAPDALPPSSTSPITLLPIVNNVQRQGDTIDLDLSISLYHADGGQINLYGLAFTARYDSPIMNWTAIQDGLQPNYTALGADVIGLRHQDSLRTDIAFTGTNHLNRTLTQQGGSEADQVILNFGIGTVDELCGGGDSIYLSIILDDILLFNSLGDTIPVSTQALSILITPAITLQINTTSATCNDYGTASLMPFDTTQQYQYLWSNGATIPNISGLSPDTYDVTVSTASDTLSTSITITGIEPLASTLTTNGSTATLSTIGGDGQYSYTWSNGQTGATATGLADGSYLVEITDGSGCTLIQSVIIGTAFRIEGNVKFPNNLGLSNVVFNLLSNNPQANLSDNTGGYLFDNLIPEQYTIHPTKDDNYTENVDLLDVIYIYLHLNGIIPFQDRYQWLAADVTHTIGSCTVNADDAAYLLRLLVGLESGFPNGHSYRFFPTTYDYNFVTDPCEFPTTRTYAPLNTNRLAQNWRGVKVGDVSGFTSSKQATSKDVLKLSITDQQVQHGQEISVPITAEYPQQLLGLHWTHHWNPKVLQFLGIKSLGIEGLTDNNFNLKAASKGQLPVIWTNPNAQGKKLPNNKMLYELRFKVIGKAGSKTELTTKPQAAYNTNLEKVLVKANGGNISVTKHKEINTLTKRTPIKFSATPNPFNQSTTLSFHLTEEAKVQLQIFNLNGQLVTDLSDTYKPGPNKITWQANKHPTGIYICRLQAQDQVHIQRLVSIK